MMSTNHSLKYRLGRHPGQQGPRPSARNQTGVEKLATGMKNNLINCKKTTIVSTLNVRTLNSIEKPGEIVALTEDKKIDIVCIQEHRVYHDEVTIQYSDLGKGWILATGSCTKNSNNSSVGGVGILMSRHAYRSLDCIEKINSRILLAKFSGNPSIAIISCYSPTNCSTDDEASAFYNALADTANQLPNHSIKIIAGDMNAQVNSADIKGFTFGNKTNRNGQLLIELLNECEMIAANTRFQKKRDKLWTFTYPNKNKAQLDYILVCKKWRNSINDCQAYNSISTIDSDHRIVSAKLRLSLRANKTSKPGGKPLDWQRFKTDNTIKMAYMVEVKNQFDALYQNVDTDTTAEDVYTSITEAHKIAAEKHIPKRQRNKKRVPWEDNKIKEKRSNLKKAYLKKKSTPTKENGIKLDRAKDNLQEAYDQEQSDYIQRKCVDLEGAAAHNQSRKVWEIVKEISGQKNTQAGRLKGATAQERLDKWKEHFVNLLGQPPVESVDPITTIVQETLPINTDPFTIEELQLSINSMSNNKACGVDEIPAEVWKSGALNDELLDVCNRMLIHGDKPTTWSKSILIPIPKKGDLSSSQNHRGIALSLIASKIYNKMLFKRVSPYIDPILRINQNGFRTNRSTLGQILTLRRLVEGIKAKNLTAVLTFVDFKKAFDTINRSKMLSILRAYGIPDVIVSAIGVMYSDTEAKVLSPDGETDFFPIHAGVLQGDTLAPFLFIITLDYAMRTAVDGHEDLGFTLEQRRSSRYPAKIITDTDFADDIALVSDNLEKAQKLLLRVERAAQEVGLHINTTKTEFMVYNQQGDLTTLDNSKLKKTEDFQYLGSWIAESVKDVNIRKAKAWMSLNKLKEVWKSELSRQLKVRFFRASVESVLLYGAETWTLTKTLEKRLDGCYTRLLRAALNVTWRDHVTNKDLYGDIPPISVTLRERRLRFCGHIFRNKDEVASQLLFWEPRHGKRSRGRPATTYINQIEHDTNLPKAELPKIMEKRGDWKELIKTVRVRST